RVLKNRYIKPNTRVRTIIDSNNPVSGTAFSSTALNINKMASSTTAKQTRGVSKRLYFRPSARS
ncbi:MAG: hypothetical protein ACYSX1_12810, partial [Planctomycetota bacterium]